MTATENPFDQTARIAQETKTKLDELKATAQQMGATEIQKGDSYKWDRLNIIVTRVSKTGEWADILVEDPGNTTWTKRQPLPLPETFKRVNQ